MSKIYNTYYDSPIGLIEITGNDRGILSLEFSSSKDNINENYVVIEAKKQLDEYFKGFRKEFNINLVLNGTPFQEKVWKELMNIKYGETVSYKHIAYAIKNEKAVRAVGNANNKNKIPIIIPCHRVIGSNNKLIGYGGGIERKEWLLNHEKRFL